MLISVRRERIGRRQGGWTLLEVIVVLVLLGIVSAVILIKAADRRDFDLYAQTEVIKTRLRYAQSRAMNSDTRYGIHFQTSGGATTYNLYRVTPGPPESEVPLAMGGEAETITMPSGIYVSGPSSDFYVSFDDWGALYNGQNPGNPYPNVLTITVSGSGGSESITVYPNTGFIP